MHRGCPRDAPSEKLQSIFGKFDLTRSGHKARRIETALSPCTSLDEVVRRNSWLNVSFRQHFSFLEMPPFRHRRGASAPRYYAAGSRGPRTDFPASSAEVTSHSGPRPAARSEKELEELVGPATETTRDHQRRHWPFNESCPRCHWIKKGDQLLRKYGRVPEGRQTPVTGEYWCVPRQRRRGGHWALGCTVCANLKRSNWIKYDTRWARCEIRTIPQACIMTAHARSDQHIRALNVRLLHRPGSDEAAAQDTPTDCEGSGVFRGSVPPQP